MAGIPCTSQLELVRRTRPGGGGRTERSFLDFVIDGSSLFDLLVARGHDLVSPLGWAADPDVEAATLQRLRLEAPLSIAGVREPVHVCAECGELGCGAVTARISASKGLVRWTDLGFENGQEDVLRRVGYDDIGPFTFEFMAYRRALTEFD